VKTTEESTPDVAAVPNPEVLDRPIRRQFSADYKRRILAEVDAAPAGSIGKVLRREGLYTSHLRDWRAARERGTLSALGPKPRGPKPEPKNPHELENARLRRELARTAKKLERAELVIDFQKKVASLLGIALPIVESGDDDERSS
jgi:transposase